GTCDMSLIDIKDNKPHVVKSKTILVGGGEIDDAIVSWWLGRQGIPYRINKDKLNLSKLRFRAEEIKIVLSKIVEAKRSVGQNVDLASIVETGQFECDESLGNATIDLTLSAKDLQKICTEGARNPAENPAGESDVVQAGFQALMKNELRDFLGINQETGRTNPGRNQAASLDCVIFSGGTCRMWVIQDLVKALVQEAYGPAVEYMPHPKELDTIDKSVAIGATLHQYYARRGNQVAIPSLNYPVVVSVIRDGKLIQEIRFEERTNLPTGLLDVLLGSRWNIEMFAKGKKIEVVVEHGKHKSGARRIPVDDVITPLGEVGWICSINEYGLVEFKVGIIDFALFRSPKTPFRLYESQDIFELDEVELDKRQRALGIIG
ncbi:MAG: hypothetical protein MN733_20275, partial [Nitrososphaera sp.]|nr:hypothetical protein [Nitrososphaera sp.]